MQNVAKEDLDGALAIATTGTTARAIDPAYPAGNALDDDPTLETRVTFTRNATPDQFMDLSAAWSTTINNRTIRMLRFEYVRLPATTVSVAAQARFANDTIAETTAAIPMAQLDPVPGTVDRYHLSFVLSQDRVCGRAALLINVAPGVTDWFGVGHFWASQALVFPDGVDAGWKYLPIDPSEVERAPSGAFAAEQYPTRWRVTAPLSAQDYARMLGTAGSPSTPRCGRRC